MGTLLNYWNNFVPASMPWLAENEQPTLPPARLNGPGSRHTLSHDAETSPCGHIQGISESLRPVFPVIQQRPLFFPWRRFPEAGRTNCLCCGDIQLTVSCQSEEPDHTNSFSLFLRRSHSFFFQPTWISRAFPR